MKAMWGAAGGVIGHGWITRWAGSALAGILFLSAVGVVASAQTVMTQRHYLEWMASICGDTLPPSDADLINWARSKGMNPTVGWNLAANLTEETMAQTLVQLFDLAPGNAKADPVRILEREGIIIPAGDGLVTTRTFTHVIRRAALSSRGRGHGHGHGHGQDKDDDQGHHGDDDGDDDDGPRPTKTKPGHGHGDKNHDHTGPPGHGHGTPPKPPKSSKTK